ncbi:PP2C family protein-serine/threonine phosphatase [Actinomadura chibensis]|uniref:Serine/threonine-protein phosphatase n=1 Tax=Actinomadura chibensis TaxID=392828 RepID=A0A5D0NR75_9ACTN|nr:PP2C family protein-serine/threonine phosphatase [Actinomadura chibensis]TYB46809.1 serine/threonine-protein phosphatase [Actinomadura chibensis]
MLRELVAASHLMSMEQLPDAVAFHAADAGLHDTLIYVVDLQQTVLRLVTGKGPDARRDPGAEIAEYKVDGTIAGRAFQTLRPVTGQAFDDGTCQYWLPILDGSERIGVLRVTIPAEDDRAKEDAEYLAGLVALMIVSKGPYSDSLSRLVRTRDMSVSAEMQWRLLPPTTFANDLVVIGAALEPAYELGGDTFDYALAGDTVHLAIFDAMGHDTTAGLTSNLAIAACRNSRLQGAGLIETGQAIEAVLAEQDGNGRFVTAVLAELDLRSGFLSWISHGHPPPVVIRDGRWVTTLECRPGAPLGTELGDTPELCSEQLQPGDRVILYSDGIVEARDPEKQEFGLERFVDFIIKREADGLPVPETLRRLIHSILEHHSGRLDDDATVLLVEWHGPSGDSARARERQLQT